MAELANILISPGSMETNIVRVGGTVKDTASNFVQRKVHIYKSGSDDLLVEVDSDGTTGVYGASFRGSTADKVRVVAFADESTGDENSQVFDFVIPKQHLTII